MVIFCAECITLPQRHVQAICCALQGTHKRSPGITTTAWQSAEDPVVIQWICVIGCSLCKGIRSGFIASDHRVVPTVSKHVAIQQPAPGRHIDIRIEESFIFRVVISGLQIIQPCLFGVNIPPFSRQFCNHYTYTLCFSQAYDASKCKALPRCPVAAQFR